MVKAGIIPSSVGDISNAKNRHEVRSHQLLRKVDAQGDEAGLCYGDIKLNNCRPKEKNRAF